MFGIYEYDLEKAVEICDEAMLEIGFLEEELDDISDSVTGYLQEHGGDWDDVTGSFIHAYYTLCQEAIEERFPDAEVEILENGRCSYFNVSGVDESSLDEVVADADEIASSQDYDENEVSNDEPEL